MYCLLNIIVIHFQLVLEAATGATVAAAMSDQLKQMDPNMKNTYVFDGLLNRLVVLGFLTTYLMGC